MVLQNPIAGVIGDYYERLCFNAQTHFYQPSDACMINHILWCITAQNTEHDVSSFSERVHIYPAVEHYILEALGASSHFQDMFWTYNYGKSGLDDYSGFWRSDHCSGHLHQRVKNIMFDHIQYIGLFALKLMLEPQCSVLIRYKYNNSYFPFQNDVFERV